MSASQRLNQQRMAKEDRFFFTFIELLHILPIKMKNVEQRGNNNTCRDPAFRNSTGLRDFVDGMPGHKFSAAVQTLPSTPKPQQPTAHSKPAQLFLMDTGKNTENPKPPGTAVFHLYVSLFFPLSNAKHDLLHVLD